MSALARDVHQVGQRVQMAKRELARRDLDRVGAHPLVVDFQMMVRLVGDGDHAVTGMWLGWGHASFEGDFADNDAERISTFTNRDQVGKQQWVRLNWSSDSRSVHPEPATTPCSGKSPREAERPDLRCAKDVCSGYGQTDLLHPHFASPLCAMVVSSGDRLMKFLNPPAAKRPAYLLESGRGSAW